MGAGSPEFETSTLCNTTTTLYSTFGLLLYATTTMLESSLLLYDSITTTMCGIKCILPC